MQPLDKELRNKLEQTVQQARTISEEAARAALEQIGVGEPTPYKHLSPQEREVRVKLRAHGRQLGDQRNSENQLQETDLLAEEVAYQHWHRMLFARFLAENDLLIYPDPEMAIPVTLEECAELATESGEARNGWELAARFAARMLPQIFRPDSPVFQLDLPLEFQYELERLLESLPKEVFTASDSLGWVYQFWQSLRKDEINASGVKIGARELPSVTQLFTEPYMVSFLLDNSLGAWWTSRRLTTEDLQTAASEDALRSKAAAPDLPLKYLRFVKTGEGHWTPAAGTFDQWPEELSELNILDPCCGSGHFLVAALQMLVPMRKELEGLTAREAVDAVLRDNLHGLEIDQRCVEIAAFALAFAAWRYPGTGGYRPLPELNLACPGLSVSVPKEEWRSLANDNARLRLALDLLHQEFSQAPLLGSLINPAKGAAADLVEWDELNRSLEQALLKERSDEEQEAGVAARGLSQAGQLLTRRYHWVITNVPYLHRSKQGNALREYCTTHYKTSRTELATVFLERCLEFCHEGGTVSIVMPQNWLFLVSYKKLRQKLLRNETWRLIARLGPGAFQTPMWDFNVQLLTINRGRAGMGEEGIFARPGEGEHLFNGIDVSEFREAKEKAFYLLTLDLNSICQSMQIKNPDSLITFEKINPEKMLSNYAECAHGLAPGDTQAYTRLFWETNVFAKWEYMATTPQQNSNMYSGKTKIILNPNTIRRSDCLGFRYDGTFAHGKKGVLVGKMRNLPQTFYYGNLFDNNVHVIIPNKEKHRDALWCFFEHGDVASKVRKIDQKLDVTASAIVKVPFDLEHWQRVAAEKYPHGLPKPYSDDPTQWLFHGHPCGSVVFNEKAGLLEQGPLRIDETVLQVAVARLLGYRWPAELDEKMELSDESRHWVKKSAELLPFADADGIVCLPSVRGEAPAAERLLDLLVASYGEAWQMDILSRLLEQVDHSGKTLETWLREKFFRQHCRLFHQRPFIWHIWDGLRDGFAAMVNYHQLDRKNLETLIYTYLGDWISRQKQDLDRKIDGAAEKLAAAEGLQRRLELILEGEKPYDIFIRWKPLEKQPIGWEPDLNDGVRLNIRPFLTVPTVGLKDAGVLRVRPGIHWRQDRGKDVPSAPWYHLFRGKRINDHHLTLKEKQAARKAAADK